MKRSPRDMVYGAAAQRKSDETAAYGDVAEQRPQTATYANMEKRSFRNALCCGERFLAERGIADASVDAWLLLEYVTGICRASYLADRENVMREADYERYRRLIFKRGSHIPLQHLTGEQEFMGFPFRVSEDVLIPRQDTETLVEEALARLRPGQRVLDLCTGSGCIAVSIAKLSDSLPGLQEGAGSRMAEQAVIDQMLPGMQDRAESLMAGQAAMDQMRLGMQERAESLITGRAVMSQMKPGSRDSAESLISDVAQRELLPAMPLSLKMASGGVQVDASELSEAALAVARRNAERLGAGVRFIQSDLFESITDRYDMIVSNPPYIRTAVIEELSEEVRLHEPRLALDGREDGLYFYRRIIQESVPHLKPVGWLLFEIGYDQGDAVARLMADAGFMDILIIKDLAGQNRVAVGRRRT